MLSLHRPILAFSTVAMLALICVYVLNGEFKEQLNLIDVVSEAGIAVMAGIWLLMVLSSRPAGRVTRFLALGLLGIMLGALADCCDEFLRIDKAALWNHWLEGGLTLGGMLNLTLGLYFWRIEQQQINLDLQKRERLFRNHLGLDAVTQLADAHYLRQQIALCSSTQGFYGSLLMFNVNDFHQINREFGHAEGDRVLLALSHLLLLNLRKEDLLCRYAGDCFVVLQPHSDLMQAQRSAEELCQAVRSLTHHPQQGNGKISLSMRFAIASLKQCADLNVGEAILQKLSQHLESEKVRQQDGALAQAYQQTLTAIPV